MMRTVKSHSVFSCINVGKLRNLEELKDLCDIAVVVLTL